MAARFVLKRGTTGKFRFDLLSTNGKVIATSETYKSKSAAQRGIESVRKNGREARLADETEATPTRGKSRSAVGRALERDWEQTKADLPGLRGKNIHQDAGDTVEQAAGKKKAPPKTKRNRS